jgi:hypothetical protein
MLRLVAAAMGLVIAGGFAPSAFAQVKAGKGAQTQEERKANAPGLKPDKVSADEKAAQANREFNKREAAKERKAKRKAKRGIKTEINKPTPQPRKKVQKK